MELIIDLNHNGVLHQFKVFPAENIALKRELYQYRYKVYKKYNLICDNPEQMDHDEYDDGPCYHLVATYDDRIVGHLRAIVGGHVPTLNKYYQFDDLPDVIQNIPHEKIFEVGRIISTPYEVTDIIPRHFVLMSLFYYTNWLSHHLETKVVVGAMKKRVVDKLIRIGFPIDLLKHYQLNYDPVKNNDPLINFFNEQLTGEICPVYVVEKAADKFFEITYDKSLAFKSGSAMYFKLRSMMLFNLYLALNPVRMKYFNFK